MFYLCPQGNAVRITHFSMIRRTLVILNLLNREELDIHLLPRFQVTMIRKLDAIFLNECEYAQFYVTLIICWIVTEVNDQLVAILKSIV